MSLIAQNYYQVDQAKQNSFVTYTLIQGAGRAQVDEPGVVVLLRNFKKETVQVSESTARHISPDHLISTGELDDYALSLLKGMQQGLPLNCSERINASAQRALESLQERADEPIGRWAEELADSVAKFTD